MGYDIVRIRTRQHSAGRNFVKVRLISSSFKPSEHHRKAKDVRQRMIDQAFKSPYIIVFCYVRENMISNLARSGGGIFKAVAERLGKKYKMLVFPIDNDQPERMEVWYKGHRHSKIEKEIFSASNISYTSMF